MIHTTDQIEWIRYNNEWNRRDLRMSLLWVTKAAAWLKANNIVRPNSVALDYGCGYFDLGRSICDDVFTVDGFDPNHANFPIARELMSVDQRLNVGLYSDVIDIPEGKYNLVLVNSVVQYFSGPAEMNDFFQTIDKSVRKGEECTLVVSDIIPHGYNKYRDALNSICVAAANGLLAPMLAHLWRSATKPGQLSLYQMDPGEFISIAEDHGWKAELLPVNLTPSRQRFSVICRRKP